MFQSIWSRVSESIYFFLQVKNEARRKSLKRRSVRLAHAKRVLQERNGPGSSENAENTFASEDDVKVVSGSTLVQSTNSNMSLISYNDFTVSSCTYIHMHPLLLVAVFTFTLSHTLRGESRFLPFTLFREVKINPSWNGSKCMQRSKLPFKLKIFSDINTDCTVSNKHPLFSV